MIIGGGIDMPYIGFDLVLALLTFFPAVLTTLWIAAAVSTAQAR